MIPNSTNQLDDRKTTVRDQACTLKRRLHSEKMYDLSTLEYVPFLFDSGETGTCLTHFQVLYGRFVQVIEYSYKMSAAYKKTRLIKKQNHSTWQLCTVNTFQAFHYCRLGELQCWGNTFSPELRTTC